MYQSLKSFEAFFEYPYEVVVYDSRGSNKLLFPSVTVCPDIWVDSQTKYCKSDPRVCTSMGQMITIGFYHFQNNATMRHLMRFAARDLFSCKMVSSKCPSFDCSDFIKPSYFRQPRAQCYMLDVVQFLPKLHPFHQCNDIWSYRLDLYSQWNPSRAMRLASDTMDTAVFVQGPGSSTPSRQPDVELPTGRTLRIGVRQLVTERLRYPFQSDCRTYERFGPAFFGQESREYCAQKCMIREEIELCGCALNLHEFAETVVSADVMCNIPLTFKCFQQISNSDVVARCTRQCNIHCRDVSYDIKVWSVRGLEYASNEMGADENLTERENGYRLHLEFYSDRIEITEEQQKLSSIELLGLFGGYAGMWVGLSLLDTLEYISFVLVNRKS
ncbi:uncharacterized protein LOC111246367 isoform X1 [Varroa destructor]|uniref:Uncharacterized protein n=1 Tax=Varroa destructor TaxID=109461 RepID=A0A7M7JV38_VARDE|nr:uncharacterized protein LOC111246367 isoform X1 [Varroa destructor]